MKRTPTFQEPYSWTPGNGEIAYTDSNGDAGGLEAWAGDLADVYAADSALRATLVIPLP